jgi:hypothetical protein
MKRENRFRHRGNDCRGAGKRVGGRMHPPENAPRGAQRSVSPERARHAADRLPRHLRVCPSCRRERR